MIHLKDKEFCKEFEEHKSENERLKKQDDFNDTLNYLNNLSKDIEKDKSLDIGEKTTGEIGRAHV